jgi:hypothetical protein
MAASDALPFLPGLTPETLAPLSPEQRLQLQGLLKAATKAQERDYAAAFDKALAHVPAILRGTIRKIIAG